MGAEEMTAITFMLLLRVMMDKRRLTNVFHVLVASQTLETRGVLYSILQMVELSLFALTAMIG